MKKILLILLLFPFISKAQTIAEANDFFSHYNSTEKLARLMQTSVPTIDECLYVFKKESEAYVFFGYCQRFLDVPINEIFRESEDWGNAIVEVRYLTDENTFPGPRKFFKPEIEKFWKVGFEGTGKKTDCWIYIENRWVFFPLKALPE